MNQPYLVNDDCLNVMKTVPDNWFDSIVCDPPYGINFMGKKWDYDIPSTEIWKECLRILKPGGHLLSFAGTRTQHRMCCNIEDSGFEIRDMIAWVYGSGFPKSLNISKAIDKFDAVGMRRKRDLKFTAWMRSSGITAKQINDLTSSNMGNHYLTDKEQPVVCTLEMFNKIKHLLSKPPIEILQMIEERSIESRNFANRKLLGISQSGCGNTDVSIHKQKGFATSRTKEFNITASATEEAKQWDGWGTALKPALEPLTLARKPLSEKTIAANILKWGVGGINIDQCRVPLDGDYKSKANGRPSQTGLDDNYNSEEANQSDIQGRFPANFIHDGSKELYAIFPETKSSKLQPHHKKGEQVNCYGKSNKAHPPKNFGGDEGSAARFFYCAKANKKDRGQGNNHPTVKPTALMQYLVKLVTPENGNCLDPFMGSGSTGKACKLEGFNFVGIEKDPEYFKIAQERILK